MLAWLICLGKKEHLKAAGNGLSKAQKDAFKESSRALSARARLSIAQAHATHSGLMGSQGA